METRIDFINGMYFPQTRSKLFNSEKWGAWKTISTAIKETTFSNIIKIKIYKHRIVLYNNVLFNKGVSKRNANKIMKQFLKRDASQYIELRNDNINYDE